MKIYYNDKNNEIDLEELNKLICEKDMIVITDVNVKNDAIYINDYESDYYY